MTDIYRQADEALAALSHLEAQARADARQAREPEPKTSEQVLADRLAAARSHWVSFDIGGSR
jgi:hypothetical protein